MKQLTPYLQWIPLAVALLVLSACASPPDKPHQPQTPPRVQPPPPPEQQTQSQSEQEQEQSSQARAQQQQPSTQQSQSDPSDSPPPPSEQAQSPPPPSADSADVEITDIPVDEHGNPIIAPDPPKSNTAENQNSSRQSASSGAPQPPPNGDSGGSNRGGSPIAGAEGGPNINVGAMTEAERVAALEQDLDGKLAKFDELMRRAREDAERDRAAIGGANAGGGGRSSRPDGQGAPQNGRGGGGQAETGSGRGQMPDLAGRRGEGQFKYSGGSVPNDIQDARDDDIVARQLREAASSESDPVLREKLWDEYRKYKKGISR